MIYRIYYYIYKNSGCLTKDFSDANDAAEFIRQVKYDYKSKDKNREWDEWVERHFRCEIVEQVA